MLTCALPPSAAHRTRVSSRKAATLVVALLLAPFGACSSQAASPECLAVFGFTLDNTSPAASTPEELARTERLGTAFSAALQHSGLYRLADMSSAASMLHGQTDVRNCNGCERDVAQKLGCKLAAYGWVQKVSNLILNINVIIEDGATGRQTAGGSVDIRGNTDESWDRGLSFLLEEHVLPR